MVPPERKKELDLLEPKKEKVKGRGGFCRRFHIYLPPKKRVKTEATSSVALEKKVYVPEWDIVSYAVVGRLGWPWTSSIISFHQGVGRWWKGCQQMC